MKNADKQVEITTLTKEEVSAFLRRGYQLVDEGKAGGCVPFAAEDGSLVVAVMDASIEDILYGLGRDHAGYYVKDGAGNPIHLSENIDDVLAALP